MSSFTLIRTSYCSDPSRRSRSSTNAAGFDCTSGRHTSREPPESRQLASLGREAVGPPSGGRSHAGLHLEPRSLEASERHSTPRAHREHDERHWLRALADAWDVSEYTLYGRFVRDVLGESGGQFVSASPLCMDYYKRVPLTVPELTTFLHGVGHEAIAVSLTSKAGMTPGTTSRYWSGNGRRRNSVTIAAKTRSAGKSARGGCRPGIRASDSGSRARRGGRRSAGWVRRHEGGGSSRGPPAPEWWSRWAPWPG